MAQRRFLRDVVGVLNSNVFSLACGIGVSILLTRILGPEGFGLYSAIAIIPIIVVSLTHLGIRGASIFHLGKKLYDENELVSTIMVLLIFSSTAGIILSIIAYYFYQEPDFNLLWIALILLIIPARLAIIYIGGVFLGKDEIKKANNLNWMTNLIHLVLAIILVWLMDMSILGAIISMLVSSLLIGGYAIYQVTSIFDVKLRIHKKIIVELLKLGVLFSVAFFFIQLNFRLDILLLQKLSSEQEVGIYSLGAHVAELLWQIPLAISIVVFSRTANIEETELMEKHTGKLLRITFLLAVLAAVAIFITAPYIIPFVFGAEFIPSVRIIQYILPGIILIVIYRILSGHLAGLGKPQVTIYIFAPALVINILLNLLWIPEYGGKGAAMATNISYALGTAGYLIAYSIILKIPVYELIRYRKSDFENIRELLDFIKRLKPWP
ncbi:MAG: oligosaccharide flippase family protein [Bacteroidota bacterium]|nr:oligosaccharide flippase family protein [Bacteroidota bacterium]